MSAETARKLLEGGLVARTDVEVALLSALIRGTPFIQAFTAQRSELRLLIEQLLGQSNVPAIRSVQARPELCQELPVGMCERLLAVPVRQESITGTVDVAAVDPFDSHVKQEFSFHLDAPVRILRAPLSEVLSALEGLHTGGAFVPRVHKMLGVAVEEPVPAHHEGSGPRASPSSQPPIPLVQRSDRAASSVAASRPGLTDVLEMSEFEADERGEPVIGLSRQKPESAATLTRARLEEADLVQVEKHLGASKSPDEVVELLAEHSCPEALALVFGVKQSEYVAKAANFSGGKLSDVVVLRGRPSVFQAAIEHGHYLGSLPETLVHSLVRQLFSSRLGPEVYAAPVFVSGRPTLVVLVTGFERSYTATRRVDRLAQKAGAALERLVLERKRSR